MINLDLINGVSFQKGCYPGQEIVARTRYLGKLKKRMFQFVAPCGGIEPGDPIHAQGDEQSVGTVVSVATLDNQQSQLLAVVRISALESPLSVRDTGPLIQLPLPYPVLETPERNVSVRLATTAQSGSGHAAHGPVGRVLCHEVDTAH